MDNSELPDFYNQDIEAEIEREESEVLLTGGRGSREKRVTHYNENMSEEQWLKQFEASDDEDIGDEASINIESRKRKAGKGRGRPKKIKLDSEPPTDPEGDIDGNTKDESMDGLDDLPVPQTAGKTSIKSARSSRGRGRAKRRSGGRGRTANRTKNAKAFIRDPGTTSTSEENRKKVSEQAKELYDYALNYRNEVDRRLADIFLVKPSKRLYPDYYMLIKYPVAFENVTKHIGTFAYDSLRETVEDFHLIFANARVYNTEGSVIYDDAVELEEAILAKYKEISGDNDPIDFSKFDENFSTQPLNLPNALATSPSQTE